MNLNELHPSLRRPYKSSLEMGVEKTDHPRCQNMWFVVPPAPPMTVPPNLPVQALAKATEILSKQKSLEDASDVDRLVSYLFLRKEAVESARIEGTMSTIEHVLTPGDLFDDWKAKSEGASVRGYAHTLEEELTKVKKEGFNIFTMDLLHRLHKGTMKFDPKFRGVPGQIREEGKPGDVVWIRGQSHRPEDSIYNPPPARHIKRCLKNIMVWMSNEKLSEAGKAGIGIPLVARIAISHAHFEGVHPFSDGNGRVGRMLITLQMAVEEKLPLYLSGFIEEEKTRYYEALQEAQKKLNYTPIIEYFSEAILASHHEATLTQSKIEKLPSTWASRGQFRKGSTADEALTWLISNPIFTIKQIQKQFDVSAQAANTAVKLLRTHGVVRERTGFERNQVFAAEEVISLLSRRFGSDPDEAIAGAQDLIARSTQKR